MIVYVLKSGVTGEIRYVGKTTSSLKRRLREHIAAAMYTSSERHVYRWIRAEKKTPVAEEVFRADSIDELNAMEKSCISFGRAIGLRLTNISDGGDGAGGFKRSPETIAKMCLKQSSAEARERKSAAGLRRFRDNPEFYRKLHDDRRKIIYCDDGRVFASLKDAAASLGCSWRSVIRALSGSAPRAVKHKIWR